MNPPLVQLHGMCVLLLFSEPTVATVSLTLRPNHLQFFSGDSVSLSCVYEGQTVDGTVKRTKGGRTEDCGPGHQDFGLFVNSSCVLDLRPSYTGFYWCESNSRQRSNRIQLEVFTESDFPFILEIPALPVVAGSDVTLSCRYKDGSCRAAYFYKNNTVIGEKVQELVISEVQRSDEGLYSCANDKFGSSPQSWLSVREPLRTSAPITPTLGSSTVDSPATASHSPTQSDITPSVLRILLTFGVFSSFSICTMVMLWTCCSLKQNDQQTA